eukprot:364741-Chlamydomonas_euryale.AAC.11
MERTFQNFAPRSTRARAAAECAWQHHRGATRVGFTCGQLLGVGSSYPPELKASQSPQGSRPCGEAMAPDSPPRNAVLPPPRSRRSHLVKLHV